LEPRFWTAIKNVQRRLGHGAAIILIGEIGGNAEEARGRSGSRLNVEEAGGWIYRRADCASGTKDGTRRRAIPLAGDKNCERQIRRYGMPPEFRTVETPADLGSTVRLRL